MYVCRRLESQPLPGGEDILETLSFLDLNYVIKSWTAKNDTAVLIETIQWRNLTHECLKRLGDCGGRVVNNAIKERFFHRLKDCVRYS